MPIVSIVMPLYNKEQYVERAVRSVLAQTVKDFELIVVNDGSTDKGPEKVKAFTDDRIRLIGQVNSGVSAARNRGIEAAIADMIALLDADDEWKADFLETVVRLRTNFPICSVFATNYLFSPPDGSTRPTILRGIPRDFHEGILDDYFAIASRSDPPLCSSAVALTKAAINSIGGFSVGVTSGEDLLTWARLAVKYNIAYSLKPCAVFWMPAGLSERPGRVPQNPDIVGIELGKLLQNVGVKHSSLSAYIALWHRMRANIYLQLQDRKSAMSEINVAFHFFKADVRLAVLAITAFLPRHWGFAVYRSLRFVLKQLRNS